MSGSCQIGDVKIHSLNSGSYLLEVLPGERRAISTTRTLTAPQLHDLVLGVLRILPPHVAGTLRRAAAMPLDEQLRAVYSPSDVQEAVQPSDLFAIGQRQAASLDVADGEERVYRQRVSLLRLNREIQKVFGTGARELDPAFITFVVLGVAAPDDKMATNAALSITGVGFLYYSEHRSALALRREPHTTVATIRTPADLYRAWSEALKPVEDMLAEEGQR